MTTKQTILRNLGIAVLTAGLVACNGADERKAKYKEEGKRYLEAGDYDKAALAFKNVQQIDPKDWENHYLVGEVLSKQGKIEPAFREFSLVVNQAVSNVMAKIRVGQLQLLSHNPDEAEKLVNEALAKQPENVEALVLKAGVLSVRNDNDAAITIIEKARQLAPDDVSATLMLASIYARLEKTEKAIEILKEALKKTPDNIPLLTMLGGTYTRNNMLVEAEDILATIIKVKPEAQNYKTLALFQVGTKQLDKAEATLRDAVQKLPDSEAAKSTLIDFLVEKRNPDLAIAELLPMVEKNPEAYDLKFKLAGLQIAKNDVPSAELTLKEIIEQNQLGPNGIKARDRLATIYALTKREDESKALVKQVLEANPRDGDGLTLRGQFNLQEGKISEAIADFRSVLVDQPNNVGVLKMLATTHLRNNEDSLARENLEKVVSLTPKDEDSRLELASLYLKAGQKDQAKQQVDYLLKNNPKSLKGLEALFKVDVAEKQWDKAQEIAKQVQQLNGKDATGYYMSGLAYEAANKLEASIDAFQQALTKKPDAVEPLEELIKVHMFLKQPDKAVAKLQQIVKQQPDHIIAYNLMGGVYLNEQKYPEAKASFLKALEVKPDWFAPYRSLAVVELVQKNKPEAVNVLLKGIDKTKGSLELVSDLARVYQHDGENDKVLALYEDSYKNHPDSYVAINNLASFLSDYSTKPADLERAAKLAEPLGKINNPALMDTVGWIAYKQGNYEKAKEMMLKVLDQQPNSVVTQYHLGMIYYKLGEKTKSAEYLEKVVDDKLAYPGKDEAKATLKKIKED